MSKWWATITFVGMSCLGVVGCGPTEGASDASYQFDFGTPADAGEVDDAAEASLTEEDECGLGFVDLGTLDAGASREKTLRLEPLEDKGTDCLQGHSVSHGRVVRFEAASDAVFSVWARRKGPAKPVVEVRADDCKDGKETVVTCNGDGFDQVTVDGETTYYAWVGVEAEEAGSIHLEYEFQQLACRPSKTPSCTNGMLEVCRDAEDAPDEFECAGGNCGNGGRCASDSCTGAAQLDVSSLPVEVPANQPAYHDHWTPSDHGDSCIIERARVPSVDAFFRLTNLSKGQKLKFDAQASDSRVAFYVLDDCEAVECRHAGAYDAHGDNVVTWTSDVDGEAILVVDALTRRNRQPFSFELRGVSSK